MMMNMDVLWFFCCFWRCMLCLMMDEDDEEYTDMKKDPTQRFYFVFPCIRHITVYLYEYYRLPFCSAESEKCCLVMPTDFIARLKSTRFSFILYHTVSYISPISDHRFFCSFW